jgi:hypothetical protein
MAEIFIPIRGASDDPDGSLRVWGQIMLADLAEDVTADAVRAMLPGYFQFGSGALREMFGSVASGRIDAVEVGDDGSLRVEGLIVDPVSIKKVRTGTLRGLALRSDSGRLAAISLVDRPGSTQTWLDLWKASTMSDTFATTFRTEFRKAMAETFGKAVESADDARANQADPVRVTLGNDAADSIIEDALRGLRTAEHDEQPNHYLEMFGVGVSGRDYYDLLLKPNGPAPRDVLLERILAAGGATLSLGPAAREMTKSQSGGQGDVMRKRQNALAPEYRDNNIYRMLVSNS